MNVDRPTHTFVSVSVNAFVVVLYKRGSIPASARYYSLTIHTGSEGKASLLSNG
jgi:hypothetical protein